MGQRYWEDIWYDSISKREEIILHFLSVTNIRGWVPVDKDEINVKDHGWCSFMG